MKTKRMIDRTLGIRAILLACGVVVSAPLAAQDAEGRVRVGDNEAKATVDLPNRDRSDRENRTEQDRLNRRSENDRADREHTTAHVGKLNKASGLLGMNVLNTQKEKLGTINDVVVDLETGKISYAVLSVGGFLGIGDKLIAVPPSAFSLAQSEDGLVLDVDKARLERMPGLTKSDWPSVDNPQLSAHWDADADAVGGSLSGQVRRDRSDRDDKDASLRSEARINTNDDTETRTRVRSEANRANSGGPTYEGRIVSIDPEKRTMRVEGQSGTREFTFTDKPTINLGSSNRNPKLVDLRVGYNVDIGYHREGDDYVAHSVIRTDPPSTR